MSNGFNKGGNNNFSSPFDTIKQRLSSGNVSSYFSSPSSSSDLYSPVVSYMKQQYTSRKGSGFDTSKLFGNIQQYTQPYTQQLSSRIDQSIHNSGSSMIEKARHKVKLRDSPNDWFFVRARNKVINYGVDVVADNAERINRAGKDFSSGVGNKVVSSTIDRYTPKNLIPLFTQPEQRSRYVQQRKQQFLQPLEAYQDPKGFMRRKRTQYKNSFHNFKDHLSSMDGGVLNKTKHGARTTVDLLQESIAPSIGAAITTMAIFNTPTLRKNTNNAMDRMFPKQKLTSKFMRSFPTKLMFTKPLSRVVGNPRFAMALAAYGVATHIGKSINDSLQLQKENPTMHKRLVDSGTDTYRSSTHRNLSQSIKNTQKI